MLLLSLVKMFSCLTTFAECDGKVSCQLLLNLFPPETLLTGFSLRRARSAALGDFSLVDARTRLIAPTSEGCIQRLKVSLLPRGSQHSQRPHALLYEAEHDECLGKALSPVQVRGGRALPSTELEASVEVLVSWATKAGRL